MKTSLDPAEPDQARDLACTNQASHLASTELVGDPQDPSAGSGTDQNERGRGPKFEVNIEGQLYPWGRNTITAADIRRLASIPPDLPVELIDLRSNVQRTLSEGEIVECKPGLGFSKKVKFQRGGT